MIKELRNYDTEKIKTMVIQLKSNLVENRFKLTQGEITNTSIFLQTRRTIAQLMTILRERNERITPKDWNDFGEKKEAGDSKPKKAKETKKKSPKVEKPEKKSSPKKTKVKEVK